MKVGTSDASKSNAISGIPLGIILRPILFAIYINDLANCLTSQCKMFDDDVNIYNKLYKHDSTNDNKYGKVVMQYQSLY